MSGPGEELKRRFETIGGDHPITQLATALSQECTPIASRLKISRMDYCIAMANAIGMILHGAGNPAPGGKPLPREEAIRRFDDLLKIMVSTYDLQGVKGAG